MAKSIKENVAGFGNLYDAMQHCANGVRWKKSVIRYLQNGLVNTGRLRKELLDGTYRIGPQVQFTVYEPKRREVIAMRFRDRQVHQSLLQNYLAAEMSMCIRTTSRTFSEVRAMKWPRQQFKSA